MVRRLGTETSPSSGSSSPTTMRKSVVFPAPLGPTRPTFSPGLSWNDASTNTSCLPYCLLILEKEIIQFQANRILGGCVRSEARGASYRAKVLEVGSTGYSPERERRTTGPSRTKLRPSQRRIHPKLLLLHPTGSTK